LDRAKPLWEMWVAENLEEDRWAIVSKVHHCMVDGVSGTDLLTVILDKEPDPEPSLEDGWNPGPAPAGIQLLGDALVERTVSPYELFRAIGAALRAPRRVAAEAEGGARGLRRGRVPG